MDEQLQSINISIDHSNKTLKQLQTIRQNMMIWRSTNNKYVCPVKFSYNTISALKTVIFKKTFTMEQDYQLNDGTVIACRDLPNLVEEVIRSIVMERVEALKTQTPEFAIPDKITRQFLITNGIITDRELRMMGQQLKMKNPSKYIESIL